MIIVRLMGGIGNQMFQYAAARRLAHVLGVQLKLDLGWFRDCKADSPRPYALCCFAISEHVASEKDISSICEKGSHGKRGLFARLMGRSRPFKCKRRIVEKHFHFDPEILELCDNAYLEGYWQSEKYFQDIADIIRTEFTITIEPCARNKQMTEIIGKSEAASLHVRRGDYALNPVTNQFHGLCSLDYYKKAIEMVASRVIAPHFFVFSDDPAWAKEKLVSEHPITFVDFNRPEKAYEDMRLMSLCRHHIIANSSFSWWGAWLNPSPNKIVVAPKRWFNAPELDDRDLIPEAWERL
jgi:hypothetical protein